MSNTMSITPQRFGKGYALRKRAWELASKGVRVYVAGERDFKDTTPKGMHSGLSPLPKKGG